MRVLIIDDNRAHGESLSDLLNSRGHEAYYAPSLDEAGWLLDLFSFCLALVDFDMPVHSGPQVARKLQTRDPDLKVIVMSARENDPERRQELGSLPFLPKPIRVDQILGLIEHLNLQKGGSSLVRRLTYAVQRYTRRKP